MASNSRTHSAQSAALAHPTHQASPLPTASSSSKSKTACGRPLQPPSTPFNPLQPPSTPFNHLQPPSTTFNHLQPPSTPLNPPQLPLSPRSFSPPLLPLPCLSFTPLDSLVRRRVRWSPGLPFHAGSSIRLRQHRLQFARIDRPRVILPPPLALMFTAKALLSHAHSPHPLSGTRVALSLPHPCLSSLPCRHHQLPVIHPKPTRAFWRRTAKRSATTYLPRW